MELLEWMERWEMLPPPGGTVLCAVSGGRDSMCLLHYLHAVAPQYGFTVAAGHFNHRMRPEADADEALVRRFCAARNISFYTDAVPVYEQARAWNLSVEETGRRLRYEFLSATADKIGAARIATAHHAGDNAETVLLNLLRGSGSEGLGGIPPVRGRFIRPLLQTPRREIEDYCAAHEIAFCDDSTNFDTHYARNRLRLELWPQLEQINSSVTAALGRTAALLREENDFLDALAAARLPQEGRSLPLDELLAAPPVLRRRMVRQLLDRLPTGKKDVTAAHIAAAVSLAEKGRGTLTLPDGARIVCGGGEMRVCVAAPPVEEKRLSCGENRWGEYRIHVSSEVEGLTVRSWQREDRLPTSRGERSLKRRYVEAGVDPTLRQTLPVICCNGKAVGAYFNEEPCHLTLHQGSETIEITIKKECIKESNNG